MKKVVNYTMKAKAFNNPQLVSATTSIEITELKNKIIGMTNMVCTGVNAARIIEIKFRDN